MRVIKTLLSSGTLEQSKDNKGFFLQNMALDTAALNEPMSLKRCLHSARFIIMVLLSFFHLSAAQSPGQGPLIRAAELRDHGEYQQAVVLLESLVRSGDLAPDAGTAWILLGSTY